MWRHHYIYLEVPLSIEGSMVEETSDVMMVVEARFFLELSEIYRQVRMHQANRSQYAPEGCSESSMPTRGQALLYLSIGV